MSRFFTNRYIKRIAQSAEKSQRRDYAKEKHGLLFRIGICSPRYKYHVQYTSSGRGYASFTGYKSQNGLYNNLQKMPSATWSSNVKSNLLSSLCKGRYFTSPRGYASLIGYRIQDGLCNNFHRILSVSNPRAHHARFSFLLSSWYKRRTSRIAQAVNFSLCRSFAVVPGIFALLCQKNYLAAAEALPLRNASCLRAQDGKALLFTRLILTAFECAKLLVRAFHLAILFSPCIAMAQFADVLGPQFRKTWIRVVRWTLESAGPVFIKWGQWAASRPDSFPLDLRAELSKLHSKAPEHSSAYSIKTIEEASKCKLKELYDGFNETPIGSGSIAQVHTAFQKHRHSAF